jgi:hypothetical protein
MLALSFALPATISFMRDQMDLGARNILTMVGSL